MHAGWPGDLAPSKAVERAGSRKGAEPWKSGPTARRRAEAVRRLRMKGRPSAKKCGKDGMRGPVAETQNRTKETKKKKWTSERAGIVRIGTLALTTLWLIEYMYNTASVK